MASHDEECNSLQALPSSQGIPPAGSFSPSSATPGEGGSSAGTSLADLAPDAVSAILASLDASPVLSMPSTDSLCTKNSAAGSLRLVSRSLRQLVQQAVGSLAPKNFPPSGLHLSQFALTTLDLTCLPTHQHRMVPLAVSHMLAQAAPHLAPHLTALRLPATALIVHGTEAVETFMDCMPDIWPANAAPEAAAAHAASLACLCKTQTPYGGFLLWPPALAVLLGAGLRVLEVRAPSAGQQVVPAAAYYGRSGQFQRLLCDAFMCVWACQALCNMRCALGRVIGDGGAGMVLPGN